MLARMDIPGAAAPGTTTVPWLVLGVVLGVGLVVLAGLVAAMVLRRGRPDPPVAERAATSAGFGEDDLPGFLESPPGSGAGTTPAGWAPLAAPPALTAAHSPDPRGRRDTLIGLAAMAVTALLLVGAAAAVAATSEPGGRPVHHPADASAPRAPRGAAARLTFGGVVLEPRAVGVTVTYPVIEVSTDGERARAHVAFPTFNCLSADAPADPVAAGCTRTVTEYADLASPDLVVDGDGNGLRVSGRFATEVRPNGGAPVPTGRVYALRIVVTPAGEPSGSGWRPAEGVLELGPGRAETVAGPGVSELRSGS
jgi:hypothetical protein